jgi:hypothetical protein
MPEVTGHVRGEVRSGPFGVEVDDANLLKFGGAAHERIQQDRRGRRTAVNEHLLVRPDARHGLIGTDHSHAQSLLSRRLSAACQPTRRIMTNGPAA